MLTDAKLALIEELARNAFYLADSGKAPDNSGYMSSPNQRYVRAVHPDAVLSMVAELRQLRKIVTAMKELL